MVQRPSKNKKKDTPPLKPVLTGAPEEGNPSALFPPSGKLEREFLFQTFHDMRNPLHAIMGYASLVLRKTREQIPKKHQENLEKVIESAERLNGIVDQMVSFYKEK
jgi:signal transduction histidine kinase